MRQRRFCRRLKCARRVRGYRRGFCFDGAGSVGVLQIREPIYVGQTYESLRSRIGRHLTNQRTDAVAMNVLDPFEVTEIEVWPFFDLEGMEAPDARPTLDGAEYTVFQLALKNSTFKAVLNEGEITPTKMINFRSHIVAQSFPTICLLSVSTRISASRDVRRRSPALPE